MSTVEETWKFCDIVMLLVFYKSFDHHQRGFHEFYDPKWRKVTKMSSAGAVFKHFGRRILSEAFGIQEKHLLTFERMIYEVASFCLYANILIIVTRLYWRQ